MLPVSLPSESSHHTVLYSHILFMPHNGNSYKPVATKVNINKHITVLVVHVPHSYLLYFEHLGTAFMKRL
jgi:hypothetical protein